MLGRIVFLKETLNKKRM